MPSPAVGEQFTLDIHITDAANVVGYEVTVTFDETALSFVSSENADFLPPGAFAVPPTVTAGEATLAATALAGASDGDGRLATVTFEVVEVKASTIGLARVALSDPAASPLPVTTVDSALTVSGADNALAITSPQNGEVVSGDVPIVLEFGENWQGQTVRLLYSFDGQSLILLFRIRLPNDAPTHPDVWETLNPIQSDGSYRLVIESDAGEELAEVSVILNNVPPQVALISNVILHLGQFEEDRRSLQIVGGAKADNIRWEINPAGLERIADANLSGTQVVIEARRAGEGSFLVGAFDTAVEGGDNDRSHVTVNVVVNTPPVIQSPEDGRLIAIPRDRDTETISLEAIDADGDEIRWIVEDFTPKDRFTIILDGDKGDSVTATIRPFEATDAPVPVTFTARDFRDGIGIGGKAQVPITIAITPIIELPQRRDDAELPTHITIGGDPLQLNVNDFFFDPDGDTLSWRLENQTFVEEKVSVTVTPS